MSTVQAHSIASSRLDLYRPIHKAIRLFMTETLATVGRMNVTDAHDCAATMQQVRALLAFCRGHLEHENAFVHPALERAQPGASHAAASDHDAQREVLDRLLTSVDAVERAHAAERGPLAHAVYLQLALFVATNFEHMHEEETAHNAVLWAHYGDAELLAIHGRILASIDAAEMQVAMRWMLASLSPGERAPLIAANAPRERAAA